MLTESRKRANDKYFDKFDDIKIRVPKGKKDEYKAFATLQNTSLNALICKLLDMAMTNEGQKV